MSTRIAFALALAALAACRTVPVDFGEPAGARIVVGDNQPAMLPATLGVLSPWNNRVELEFDVPTLVGYGMSPERAQALVAAGKAKIVGRLAVRSADANSDEHLRYALPGAAVVRSLESGEQVRVWWPAEGKRTLWFEGSAGDDGSMRSLSFGEKNVTSHTGAQKSKELQANIGGATIAVMLILVVVFASV